MYLCDLFPGDSVQKLWYQIPHVISRCKVYWTDFRLSTMYELFALLHPGPIDLTDSTCDFSKYCIYTVHSPYKTALWQFIKNLIMWIHHFIYHIYHIWDILGPGDIHFSKHHQFVRSSTTFMRRWLCVGNLIFSEKTHRQLCRLIVRKTKTQRLTIMLILLCWDRYWSYNPTALQLIVLEFISNG